MKKFWILLTAGCAVAGWTLAASANCGSCGPKAEGSEQAQGAGCEKAGGCEKAEGQGGCHKGGCEKAEGQGGCHKAEGQGGCEKAEGQGGCEKAEGGCCEGKDSSKPATVTEASGT